MPDVASLHDRALALRDRTVAVRRDLHAHPEIAFEEVRTMGVIADRLRDLGLDPKTGVGRTGVVAVWDSGRPGPTVLARADIDALPMPDEKTVAYASQNAGACHACGHDGHTAILLSVAEIVAADQDDLCGRVVFLFQPAEEVVRGAEAMIADGALDGLEIDHVLGLHLSSEHPTGHVSYRTGPAMAATDRFRIVVHGHGGHAAKPNETTDPVLVSSHLVLALQALVSRESDPVAPRVISVTSVQGGTAYNIIPESVELKGTLRTFDATLRETLTRRIHDVAGHVCATFGATAEVEWIPGSPAVVNDVDACARFGRLARAIVGDAHVDDHADQIMGGDDMALFLQRAPGCYFFVGGRGSDASSFPHHHPKFDLDEACLPVAVELFAAGIVDLLRSGDA